VVDCTERDRHAAEKGYDFVDNFHDGILMLLAFSYVTFITKRSLLLNILPIKLL